MPILLKCTGSIQIDLLNKLYISSNQYFNSSANFYILNRKSGCLSTKFSIYSRRESFCFSYLKENFRTLPHQLSALTYC